MNIIEFVTDPKLIGDKSLSPAQRMALKSVYGLPLDAEELELFKKTTELENYPGQEQTEVTFLLGRRSGKSDKLASNIALYEACIREHEVSKGETPVVMVCAPEMARQSKIVFRYILGKIEASPILKRMIKRVTTEEIELQNGCLIQVFPADQGRIRGQSLACFIADECAYFKVEGKSVDIEILEAVRPGLSFEHSKIVKISTPALQRGEIWNDFNNYYGKVNGHCLVFRGSTALFNPVFSKKKLAKAKERDPLVYETEFEATRFRSDLSAMYDPLIIDRSVNSDRPAELPYRSDFEYYAFADVAGGGGKDSYALAIGHLEEGKVIIDIVRSRVPKFNPDEVTAQYCELLKSYQIASVTGDKFSGDWSLNSFAKNGIEYRRSEKNKSQLYLEAEGAFNTARIEIPKKDNLVIQLKSLVRKARSGGHDSVDSDSGQPEDEANAICGVAAMAGVTSICPQVFVLGGLDEEDPWERQLILENQRAVATQEERPDPPEWKEWTTETFGIKFWTYMNQGGLFNAAKNLEVDEAKLRYWFGQKGAWLQAVYRARSAEIGKAIADLNGPGD